MSIPGNGTTVLFDARVMIPRNLRASDINQYYVAEKLKSCYDFRNLLELRTLEHRDAIVLSACGLKLFLGQLQYGA